MRNFILILLILNSTLNADAFFAKPRVKLNHDVTDDNLIMALDSGKKVTVEFHNVTVCKEKECYTVLEIPDNLKNSIKVIGAKASDKLDKADKQAHHTIEVEYNTKASTGYVNLKDPETNAVLHKIKVLIKNDTYCYEANNPVKGKLSFPDGAVYILNFDNQCELEKAGAKLYENN